MPRRIKFPFQSLMDLRERRCQRMEDIVLIMLAKRGCVSTHRLNLRAKFDGG